MNYDRRPRQRSYRKKYFRKDFSARRSRTQEYVNIDKLNGSGKEPVDLEEEKSFSGNTPKGWAERIKSFSKNRFSFANSVPQSTNAAFSYQPSLLILLCLSVGIIIDRFSDLLDWQDWYFGSLFFLAFWIIYVYFNRRAYQTKLEYDYSFIFGPAQSTYPAHWYDKIFKQVPFRIAFGSLIMGATLLCFGGLRHHLYWYLYYPHDLSVFCRQESDLGCVRGVVSCRPVLIEAPTSFSPIPQNDKTVFELDVQSIRRKSSWTNASGACRVSVSGHLLGVHVGDLVEITGRIAQPAGPDAPGNFDYRDYLRSQRILSVLSASYPSAVKRINQSQKSGRIWSRILEYIQEAARKNLFRHIDFRQARLASAILLGNRSDLPSEMVERFQETGTIHILVVSGLHVSMLTVLLNALMCPLPFHKNVRILLIAGIILVYVAVTGWQPPAVRAGILSAVGAIAYLRNQKILSFNVLGTAGIAVLLYNPSDLFNAGTQLSFLTVGVIVAVSPIIQSITQNILPEPWRPQARAVINQPRKGWRSRIKQLTLGKTATEDARWVPYARSVIRNGVGIVLVSICVLAIIAPLVATRFHVLSFFSILLSLLLWIPIFISTAFGMVTMFLGAFEHSILFSSLAQGTGQVTEITLWMIEYLVQTVHSWRWGRIWTCGLSEWMLAIFYILLIAWTFIPFLRRRTARMGAALALWAALAALIPLFSHLSRPHQVDLDFVNVGHGGCTIIQMPNGQTLLFDAGQMTAPHFGAQTVSCLLWSRGITKIHGVVISHADADHYNMLPDLAERFAIDTVYVSSSMFLEKENALLAKFQSFLDEAHVNIIRVRRGDCLGEFPGWKLEILHPGPRAVLDPISMENANSIVLNLQYGSKRALLTGDIAGNGQADLIQDEYPAPVDVLQAPHHGASNCNENAFINWSRPRNVVIGESPMNPQNKVCLRYRDFGANVFHTGLAGSTHFVFKSVEESVKR